MSLLVRDGSRVLFLGGDADPFDDAVATLCAREGATFLGTHDEGACAAVGSGGDPSDRGLAGARP